MGFSIVIINQSSVLFFLHIDIGPELTMAVDMKGSVPGASDRSTRVSSAETLVLHSHRAHLFPGFRAPVAHWRDLMPGACTEIECDHEWTLTIRQVVRLGTVERVIRIERDLILHMTSPEPLSWVLEEVEFGIEIPEDREQPRRQQQQSVETVEEQPMGTSNQTMERTNIIEPINFQIGQIQSLETHENCINVELNENIFNTTFLNWDLSDKIIQKIYADLTRSLIRTRYSTAVAKIINSQQPNNNTEYDYFLNNPQIIHITHLNERVVNHIEPLLFESFLLLTDGNSLSLSFNYSNEFYLQNSESLSIDFTSQLSFPTRFPEVGPRLCLDIFHIRVGQMTDWEKHFLYQLIFEQKINNIGSTHGCIIPLIDLSSTSITIDDSCAFLRMKIAQFAICLTQKEMLIGSYVRELLKIIAKVRIKLIDELVDYVLKTLQK